MASVNPDGSPHVTPIGSVVLTGPGTGIFADIFNAQLSRNLDRDPRVTVLAVDSGWRFWLQALVTGRFKEMPGVQLAGTAGPRRAPTAAELDRLGRVFGPFLRTKGGRILWSDIRHVRDLSFEIADPVRIGRMTATLPRHRTHLHSEGRPPATH